MGWRDWLGLSAVSIQTIDSVDQLESILDSEQAIIFLDADWSATSKWRKISVFDKLYVDTQTQRNLHHVTFAILDVSQKSDIKAAAQAWLENQMGRPVVLGHGNGEMLWIKDGSLVEYDNTIDTENSGLEKRLQLIQDRFN